MASQAGPGSRRGSFSQKARTSLSAARVRSSTGATRSCISARPRSRSKTRNTTTGKPSRLRRVSSEDFSRQVTQQVSSREERAGLHVADFAFLSHVNDYRHGCISAVRQSRNQAGQRRGTHSSWHSVCPSNRPVLQEIWPLSGEPRTAREHQQHALPPQTLQRSNDRQR